MRRNEALLLERVKMYVVIEYISVTFDTGVEKALSKVFGPYSREAAEGYVANPANAGRDIEVRKMEDAS